ncbi:rRNA-binding ribosome biosynthesis protein [Coemansia nantahalensis]|uniref:rRNA-binding ribosome biosynthesis protein n=2 Tax=Coemansia TaxID=4863 RepID=A0ACC1LH57_9FUNG|nr:rRNA-binding ribosome biosynthesis protein [Coemansia nantahalensis]KAJ2807973.1 rRNA-binding ribosome biosynthesis protein [Coemansia helicoidea]
MGHGRKKRRTHVVPTEDEIKAVPKALVVKSGEVGRAVATLVGDVRQVMEPNTAIRLRERKTNKIKDYVAVSSQLSLSHIMLFSQTETGTNLRIGRFPHGPTLHFRVNQYSLAQDCLRLQKTPHTSAVEYNTPPLLILNNFAGDGKHLKLMTAMLQNMFPAINPSTMRLAEARRVVLFNYNSEADTIDFRHYAITVRPVGVTKGVKRVVMSKAAPSMAKFGDISDYVMQQAFASESDVEDGPENSVTLAQDYVGRNNAKDEQRAVRLMELGPRMELKLMKVESGLCEGEVIYHSYVKKTPEDIALAEKRRQANLSRQALRRQQQQENVDRKKEMAARAKAARNDTTRNIPVSEAADYEDDDDMESDDGGAAGDGEDEGDSDSDADAGKATGRRAADDFGMEAYDEDAIDESDGEEQAEESDDQPPPRPAKRARSKAGGKKK